MKRAGRLSDEEREALEREREFLLRSLDDLDRERVAGNIDDATYDELHADYTARAAGVLRRLDGTAVATTATAGLDAPAEPASRRLLTVGAIVVIAIVAVVFVIGSVGDREPGGSLTGNAPQRSSMSASQRKATLAAAVKANPKDYSARIAYARALLNGDPKDALEQYDTAAKLAPDQPEPFVYGGWIRGLVARQLPAGRDRDVIVDAAIAKFDQAEQIAPTYPDTFVFRGLVRYLVLSDAKAAIPDFQRFLQLAPDDHPMRRQVLDVLAEAERASGTTTTSSQP
jgi:tetratricopeptide (TPR) repeat protein